MLLQVQIRVHLSWSTPVDVCVCELQMAGTTNINKMANLLSLVMLLKYCASSINSEDLSVLDSSLKRNCHLFTIIYQDVLIQQIQQH